MTRSRKRIFLIAIATFLALVAAVLLYESFTAGLHVPTNPRAQSDILSLGTQLRVYAAETGSYPTTEQGLSALVSRPTKPPIPANWRQRLNSRILDPWGRPYVYSFPSANDPAAFDLFSVGPDGVVSADDIRAPQ